LLALLLPLTHYWAKVCVGICIIDMLMIFAYRYWYTKKYEKLFVNELLNGSFRMYWRLFVVEQLKQTLGSMIIVQVSSVCMSSAIYGK